MIRSFIIVLGLFFCISEVKAQELYTQYIVKAFEESTYTRLMISHPENGNTIIGSGRNQTGPYDFFVLKTDNSGQVTSRDTLERIGIYYIDKSSQYVMLNDSIALVPEYRNKVIQKVDVKNTRFDGEIQIEKVDTSSNFYYYAGIMRYKDGYACAGMEVKEDGARKAVFTILDNDINIIKENNIDFPESRGSISEVINIGDSTILFIGEHWKTLPNGRNKVGLFIAKRKENGEVEIIYKSELPDTIGITNAKESIVLDNNDIILHYGYYTYTNENEPFYDLWGINRLMRFNLDGEVMWDKSIGWANPSSRNEVNRILPSNDDDNFIYVGQQSPNDYHYLDTIIAGGIYDENGDTIRNYAIISKFDEDGNEIWHRSYRYWGDLILGNNRFEDVVPLQDKSGYHLLGTSHKKIVSDTSTFAWMWQMTVDNYGCLVPGCHLPSSVDEGLEISKTTIDIYPNPTLDFANILNDGKYTYRLIDNIGATISAFESTSYDETIVLDMRSYASGIYYLQKCKGKDCLTEKFIKN